MLVIFVGFLEPTPLRSAISELELRNFRHLYRAESTPAPPPRGKDLVGRQGSKSLAKPRTGQGTLDMK